MDTDNEIITYDKIILKHPNMKIRLHTKDNRWGISRGKHHVKLQLGSFRIYFSITALKPKYASTLQRAFRRKIFKRDGYVCAGCGKKLDIEYLTIHHIKPKSEYPDLIYDPDNCQTLCRNCHKLLHQKEQLAMSGIKDTISVDPALPTAAVIALTN